VSCGAPEDTDLELSWGESGREWLTQVAHRGADREVKHKMSNRAFLSSAAVHGRPGRSSTCLVPLVRPAHRPELDRRCVSLVELRTERVGEGFGLFPMNEVS
jgi:hypothetical protein